MPEKPPVVDASPCVYKRYKEQAELVRDYQKSGQLVSINVPAQLFGSAHWSGLSKQQLQIIQALMREVAMNGHDSIDCIFGCTSTARFLLLSCFQLLRHIDG